MCQTVSKKPQNDSSFLTNGFHSAEPSTTLSGTAKREKPAYIYYKTTTAQKVSKIQQTSASQRIEKKRQSQKILISLLKRIGEKDLSSRLEICGSKFSVTSCGQHVISRRPNYSCNFRLCPFCASKRSAKLQRKYLPLLTEFSRTAKKSTPVHLVLTISHRKSEILKESRARLMTAFKKLQRRAFWSNHFYGGIYAFESTLTETGHHAHLHIIAFRRRFFDVALLRREWLEITGDSCNFRLDRITDFESGLREIVKYISKPLDIEKFTPKVLSEHLSLKGARLFGAFGLFAKFCRELDASDYSAFETSQKLIESYSGYCEGDACPICGQPLFETVLSFEELIKFLRKTEQIPRC